MNITLPSAITRKQPLAIPSESQLYWGNSALIFEASSTFIRTIDEETQKVIVLPRETQEKEIILQETLMIYLTREGVYRPVRTRRTHMTRSEFSSVWKFT